MSQQQQHQRHLPHSLRDLLRDDDQLVHRELVLAQVQVRVQRVP